MIDSNMWSTPIKMGYDSSSSSSSSQTYILEAPDMHETPSSYPYATHIRASRDFYDRQCLNRTMPSLFTTASPKPTASRESNVSNSFFAKAVQQNDFPGDPTTCHEGLHRGHAIDFFPEWSKHLTGLPYNCSTNIAYSQVDPILKQESYNNYQLFKRSDSPVNVGLNSCVNPRNICLRPSPTPTASEYMSGSEFSYFQSSTNSYPSDDERYQGGATFAAPTTVGLCGQNTASAGAVSDYGLNMCPTARLQQEVLSRCPTSSSCASSKSSSDANTGRRLLPKWVPHQNDANGAAFEVSDLRPSSVLVGVDQSKICPESYPRMYDANNRDGPNRSGSPAIDSRWTKLESSHSPQPPSVSGYLPKSSSARGRAISRQSCKETGRSTSKDEFLVQSRLKGLSYKEIQEQGGFKEAESTLRGRFRMLTKDKTQRVRRPRWTDTDVRLLKEAVAKNSKLKDPLKSTTVRRQKGTISWLGVAEYIFEHGGTYRFGNATCRKKWDEVSRLEN